MVGWFLWLLIGRRGSRLWGHAFFVALARIPALLKFAKNLFFATAQLKSKR